MEATRERHTPQTSAHGVQGWRARLGAAFRVALRQHGAPLALALIAGGALRLLWIGDTQFLGDQAELLSLGQSAAQHHALIITGILSSINTLNPPVSGWMYGFFAILGGPLAATIFTALANVFAVGMLYALAARYSGRLAGFVAAMLYATASGPIYYSRFIWQQNLLAPVLIALLWVILAGVIERRKWWLAWAALLWSVAFQLHPTAIALAPVIAVAVALTWRDLSRREYTWAIIAFLAPFAPMALWELASHGYDIPNYLSLSSGHASTDIVALTMLARLLAPASPDAFGASSYTVVGAALQPLGVLVALLALGAAIYLGVITLRPWLSRVVAPSARLASLASSRWRLAAILLIWQVAPVAALIHHSRKVPEHYLLVILPVIYIAIGLLAAAATRWIEPRLHGPSRRTTRWALVLATLAIATTQAIGVVAELRAIHTGAYSAVALPLHYGIPLSGQESTLSAAASAGARANADVYVAATKLQQESYGYLAQTSPSRATVYQDTGCLIVPSPAARPIVTLALPGTLAYSALGELEGVHSLGTVRAQGDAPLRLYEEQPGSRPAGETGVSFEVAGTHPTAYAYTHDASGHPYLSIRWTGAPTLVTPTGARASYWYGAPPTGPIPANYEVMAQPLGGDGQPVAAPMTSACQRLSWRSGVDLLSWIPLPTSLANGAGISAWRVTLTAQPLGVIRPTLGPLPLETGAVSFGRAEVVAGPSVFPVAPAR